MKCALNARLLSAAELIRQNVILADIGTDHGYLPIFLLEQGRISHAFCCDINEGPLNSARRNAEEAGFTDRMSFVLTDGAAVLSGRGISDYAICGMGGELIADIISRAEQLRDPAVRLILQPMTRQEKLREYLASEGFKVLSESYSFDAGKHYVCLLAVYDGRAREITPLEAVTGFSDSDFSGRECRIKYLENKLRSLERAAEGKRQSGADVDADRELTAALKDYINTLRKDEI